MASALEKIKKLLAELRKLPPKERLIRLKQFKEEHEKVKKKEIEDVGEEAREIFEKTLEEVTELEEEEETLSKRGEKEVENLEEIAEEVEDVKKPEEQIAYRTDSPYKQPGQESSQPGRTTSEIYQVLKSANEDLTKNQYLPSERRYEAAKAMNELRGKEREGYFHGQSEALHVKTSSEKIWDQLKKDPTMQRYD